MALGSGTGGVTGRAFENGRKGGESSSSSSASDKGLSGALDEYLGRRANIRLLFIGCGASEPEEEEVEESLATAEGLAVRSRECCLCLGDTSTDRRLAKKDCRSLGVRSEALTWVTVLFEAVRDSVPTSMSAHYYQYSCTNYLALALAFLYSRRHGKSFALSVYVLVMTVLGILVSCH